MIIINNSLRKAIYHNKDIYIVKNDSGCYGHYIRTIVELSEIFIGRPLYKPESLVFKTFGEFEYDVGGHIYFNLNCFQNSDGYNGISVIDYASYQDIEHSEYVHWDRCVVVDFGKFIYKLHFLYSDEEAEIHKNGVIINL